MSMFAVSSINRTWVRVQLNDKVAIFSTEQARNLAKEILCQTSEMEGADCLIACFKGSNFNVDHRENLSDNLTDLVDHTVWLDAVEVYR